MTDARNTPADQIPRAAPDGVALGFNATRLVLRVLITCLLLEVIFVLLDYHVSYGRLTTIGALRRLTAIAREDGLASWFGTTQTLLASLTAWGIVAVVRAQEAARWRVAGWTLVAMLFTYMAVDDGAQIHERVGTAVQVMQRSDSGLLTFFPSYTWQIVFGPMFMLLGLTIAVFLWRELSDRLALAMVFGALGCFGLALGLDFIEGLDASHPLNPYRALAARTNVSAWAADRFGRTGFEALDHFGRSLEEFLEMLGGTLFWAAFLRTLTSLAPELRVRWNR